MTEALSEITLRKYEKPFSKDERELTRKLCLSLGLLQESDKRDVVVDVLLCLIRAAREKKEMKREEIVEEVKKIRQERGLEMKGIASSNIRRQLKRLKDLMIIEKNKGYQLVNFMSLQEIIIKIEKFLVPDIFARVKEYALAIENLQEDEKS